MNVNRRTALIFFLVSMVFIPLFLLSWIFFGQDTSKLMCGMKIFVSGLYVMLIFATGYWGLIFYYLRYLLVGGYFIVSALSIKDMVSQPFIYGNDVSGFIHKDGILFGIYLLISIILLYLIKGVISALSYDEKPINLQFPFNYGKYYVLEGGDSKEARLINYHFSGASHKQNSFNKSMRYAVDLVKINSKGSFAKGILPRQLNKYEIYEENLFSPCYGKIIEVVDGRNNEVPFSGKHPYNVGNYIVIENNGVNIVIGHMQKNSIKVKVGDYVIAGQPIGKVGNPGLTEFPHLHIQAMKAAEGSMWNGEGVPILFDGVFLVKNKIVNRI